MVLYILCPRYSTNVPAVYLLLINLKESRNKTLVGEIRGVTEVGGGGGDLEKGGVINREGKFYCVS